MIQEFKKDVKQNIPKNVIQFKVQLHNIKKLYCFSCNFVEDIWIVRKFDIKHLVLTFSFIYRKTSYF